MTNKHPYCRTCGSFIQEKEVCPYCGCEPLKGHNYCCDCGTSTIPEAIMCVHCGASFQRKFPATLAVLISIALAVTVAGAVYFIKQRGSETEEKISETNNSKVNTDSAVLYKAAPRKKDEGIKIINNIPTELINKRNDVISRLINKLPKNIRPAIEPEPEPKPVMPPKPKDETVIPTGEKPPTTSGRVSMNAFSAGEMRNYSVGCTYFEGRSKNNVVFFTTNISGYVKVNGKAYALQGVEKGNDIARFSGTDYEVTIEILGLAGNEKEWLAEASMVIKDIKHRTFTRRKVYSSCTDF
jgi:Methionyl-tRNA synthetase